jgi:hypothetical protein
MQKPYISLFGQMAYVLTAGPILLLAPNVLLPIFGFAPTNEIWIRVLGLLVIALAFYYYALARRGNRQTVNATVQGRLFFCGGLVAFVIIGLAPPALIGFALAETGLAVWTWWELRQRTS